MSPGCNIQNISHFSLYNGSLTSPEVVLIGIFVANGCLCTIFAFLTNWKYTSVTVLNYSVNTIAISNTRWIWFFIFTAISSFVNGLLNLIMGKDSIVPFILGWISHLFAVLSLAFAIKYQWKYKEEAFHNMSSEVSSEGEKTPILYQSTETKRPTFTDFCLIGLVCISCAVFIPAVIQECDSLYWIALGSSWFVRITIYVMVFVIHHKLSLDGPSILIKCLLLAGVLLNTFSDIPSYIWMECIFEKDAKPKDYYIAVISIVLISNVMFFVVLRAEFLRLKDITRWHIADHIDHLEGSGLRTPK